MPKINLVRKVEIEGKWQTLPVARFKASKAEPVYDFSRVLLRKVPTVVLGGTYYLEYRDESGKRVRRAVGTDPREVKAALATQRGVLAVRKLGGEADDAPQMRKRDRPTGPTIADVAKRFAERPGLEYRARSIAKYRNALDEFTRYCGARVTHVSQLGREDIREFMTWLVRDRHLEIRTALNKAVAVVKLMRDAGAPIVMVRGDWPRITEPQPEVYRPELLQKLFAACTQDEYECFQTFLQTGLREQELVHLEWGDFDARRSIVSVRKKPGFDPKTYQERGVPIPRALVDLLAERRRRQLSQGRDDRLIFATTKMLRNKGQLGSQPDNKLLRKLKSLAYRSYLNCGHCIGQYRGKADTCANAPICTQFGLHKFRHTYATTMLREGIDLRSLQMLLGHNELASTEKYLRAQEPEMLVDRINRTAQALQFSGPSPETQTPAPRRRRIGREPKV